MEEGTEERRQGSGREVERVVKGRERKGGGNRMDGICKGREKKKRSRERREEDKGGNVEEEKREKTEENGGWKQKESRSKEDVGKIRREGVDRREKRGRRRKCRRVGNRLEEE